MFSYYYWVYVCGTPRFDLLTILVHFIVISPHNIFSPIEFFELCLFL
jgi:hypothetical protein